MERREGAFRHFITISRKKDNFVTSLKLMSDDFITLRNDQPNLAQVHRSNICWFAMTDNPSLVLRGIDDLFYEHRSIPEGE